MSEEYWPNFYNKYPSIFSFINFRKEKNGGFIFNPYLYTEKWMDDLDFQIIEKIDGVHSVKDIIYLISKKYKINQRDADNRVISALQELNSYYAITFSNEQRQKKPSMDSNVKKDVVQELDYYSAPLSVLWNLTYKCNMKCKHCLNGDPVSFTELDLNDINEIFTQLKQMKIFSINFSGGEPLLRDDIFDVLKSASELHFGVRLSTNGLLLDQDNLKTLRDLEVYCLQISLDGLGDTHDEFRGINGAYEKTVESLRMASEMGFYTTMSTMIIRDNAHEIGALLDLAVSLGVSSFKLNSFVPMGRGSSSQNDLVMSKQGLRDLAAELIMKKQQYADKISIQMDALFPWLLNSQDRSDTMVKGLAPDKKLKCSAGYTTLVISPDGAVYPCPYLTEFPIGNMLDDSLYDIWHNNEGILGKFRNIEQRFLKGKCSTCRFVPQFCDGGCRAASYIVNGDFFGESPFCWKC